MSRDEHDVWPWLVAAGAVGGAAAFLASQIRAQSLTDASSAPEAGRVEPKTQVIPLERPFSTLDVEAAARMLSSENPRGSERLHVEQIWTQIRSKRKKQSLFDRITNGSGWGEQGQKVAPGGKRPVSSEEAATNAFRTLAIEVLSGQKTSRLDGARKFFEPAQQDLAFKKGEEARKKLAAGMPLLPKERRLLGYRKTARDVRADWLRHAAFLDTIDGVEFYT